MRCMRCSPIQTAADVTVTLSPALMCCFARQRDNIVKGVFRFEMLSFRELNFVGWDPSVAPCDASTPKMRRRSPSNDCAPLFLILFLRFNNS